MTDHTERFPHFKPTTDQRRERLVGLRRSAYAIQREYDSELKKLLEMDSSFKKQYGQYVAGCRSCNHGCCSECTAVCPECGDSDPLDILDDQDL